MNMPTVKVVDGDSYRVINQEDYEADKSKYTLYTKPGASDDDQPGNVKGSDGRNTSGTYSEPTPTDVRYPDKLTTEFENNGGAPKGQSAAELREAAGIKDAPGGLAPHVHEQVKAAEAALASSLDGESDIKIKREVSVEGTHPDDAKKDEPVAEPAKQTNRNNRSSENINNSAPAKA